MTEHSVMGLSGRDQERGARGATRPGWSRKGIEDRSSVTADLLDNALSLLSPRTQARTAQGSRLSVTKVPAQPSYSTSMSPARGSTKHSLSPHSSELWPRRW